MISRPQPHAQQGIPRPYPPQEALLTKAAPLLVAIPLVVMVGAILVPAVAVAPVGVLAASILRFRWWVW
jgi:hypothetical protein